MNSTMPYVCENVPTNVTSNICHVTQMFITTLEFSFNVLTHYCYKVPSLVQLS